MKKFYIDLPWEGHEKFRPGAGVYWYCMEVHTSCSKPVMRSGRFHFQSASVQNAGKRAFFVRYQLLYLYNLWKK